MAQKADVDYSKVLIADIGADGGMGTVWEAIEGYTRQGTASLAGSDADKTSHKNVLSGIIKESIVKGDNTFNFQCADVSAENKAKLMGGTVTTSADGTQYKAPLQNQDITKSIIVIGRDGVLDYVVNLSIDAYITKSDDDLYYIQVNGTVLKPDVDGLEAQGSWDDYDLSSNDILSFVLAEETGAATIDDGAHTVTIEVANGTVVTALVPTIGVSLGAIAAPNSLVAQDFTTPVVYTITAADGTTQTWTVTVTVAA